MKKTISLILCFAMLLSTVAFCLPAMAIEIDFGVESSENFATIIDETVSVSEEESETAELAAVATTMTPGLNLLTGSTAPYTFEDLTTSDVYNADTYGSSTAFIHSVSNIGLADESATNKAMKYTSYRWPHFAFMKLPQIEADRPFVVSLKAKNTSATARSLTLIRNWDNETAPVIGKFTVQGTGTTTDWQSFSATITSSDVATPNDTTPHGFGKLEPTTQDVNRIYFMVPAGDGATSSQSEYVYVDDISIVPYYKVTYYDADGKTVLHTEYLEPASTSYAISAAAAEKSETIDKFLGFKLAGTADDALVTEAVTLANRDVNFVAVVDKNVIAPEFMSAKAGATVTITSKYEADWSVDDETVASIAGNGTSAVLTAKGYAAEVTVTATSKEDANVSESVVVRLRGGEKARPGVNLMTGTKAPYDFDVSDAEAKLSYSFAGQTRRAENPDKSVNPSTTVVQMYVTSSNTGKIYPKLVVPFNTAMVEMERPVQLDFDYVGKSENLWIIEHSDGTAKTVHSSGTATSYNKTEWTHVTHEWKASTKKMQFHLQGGMPTSYINTPFYIDNVSLTPYYKVTFLDATGNTVETLYVDPDETSYTIPAEKLAFNTDKYAGYKVNGEGDVVTSVALAYEDVVLQLVAKDGIEFTAPVSVTGHNGKTTDIDPRYPGAYYVFDEPLDTETLTLDNLKGAWADSFKYDADTNTLILFPQASKFKPGWSGYFQEYDSNVKTVSGKFVVFPQTPNLAYAATVPADGKNMIPYSDIEDGYNPFYYNMVDVSVAELTVTVETDETAGKYAAGNPARTGSGYPQLLVNTVFENGGVYKIFGRVKNAGTYGDATLVTVPSNMVLYTGGNATGSDIKQHSDIPSYHIGPSLGNGTDWHEYEVNFIPTAETELIEAQAGYWTTPNGGNLTGIHADYFEIYKRSDVIYQPNAAVSTEDVEAPANAGAFLYTKGNVKATDATVTVVANPYEAVDAKRMVDGWKAVTDGIVYHEGDVIDLHEVELNEKGNYVLEPNIVANSEDGYKFAEVTFVCDGLNEDLGVIDDVYMNGDTIDLTEFYDVTPVDTAKRFVGWSTTGDVDGFVDSITIDEDANPVTVYAVVNYDFNFAFSAQAKGHSAGRGTLTHTGKVLHSKYTSSNTDGDDYFEVGSVSSKNIPVYKIKGIEYIVANKYVNEAVAEGESGYALKFSDTHASGKTVAAYFKTSNSTTQYPMVNGKLQDEVYVEDGVEYVRFAATFAGNAQYGYGGKFTWLRTDLTQVNGAKYAFDYRYIRFVPYDEFEGDVVISGLEVPETGATPVTTVTANEGVTVKSVTWTPEFSAGGLFKENTEYAVEVVIAPTEINKYRFKDDVKVTFGDYEAVVTDNQDATFTATFTFPETEPYKLFDFDLSTVPEELVIENAEPVQLTANVTEREDGVNETIVWSLTKGTEFASITEDGLLTINNVGEITVKAVSAYNENKVYEKDVTVSLADTVSLVTVSFVGDITEPFEITKLSGATLDLGEYLDVTSSVEGKRFNGWSLTGELADLTTGEITVADEDMEVYAIVNYDFNFAIPANASGWGYNGGKVELDGDFLVSVHNAGPKVTDVYTTRSSLKVPAYRYKTMIVYLDEDYTVAGEPKKFTAGFAPEGFYFSRTGGEGDNGNRRVSGKVTEVVDGIAALEFKAYTHNLWNGTLAKIRLDIANSEWTYGIRYIRFIEAPLTETNVLDIQNVQVPVLAEDVTTTGKEMTGIGTVKSVTWKIGDAVADNFITYTYGGTDYTKFNAETAYTAEIVVTNLSGVNARFPEELVVTVNGNEADYYFNDAGEVVISYTFEETDPFVDYAMEISGPTEIHKSGRVTPYTLKFTGEATPIKTASWSVDDESVATIDEQTGKLTPKSDGTVTVTATSHYNPEVTASIEVEVTNQATDGVVIYNAGTQDETSVTGLPENTTGKGTLTLSTAAPEREGYVFAGWATSAETTDTVTTMNVAANEVVNVYATWQKVLYSYEFNGTTEGFSVGNGSITAGDTYLVAKTSSSHDIRLASPNNISIDPTKCTVVVIRLATDIKSTAQFWYGAPVDNGNLVARPNPEDRAVVLSHVEANIDNFHNYVYDMTKAKDPWTNYEKITRVWFDCTNAKPAEVRIDYIRFLNSQMDVTFDANAGSETVEGMPEDITVKQGDVYTVAETPVREGYKFLGWSKVAEPGEGDTVKTSYTIVDDTTLYAVWSKFVEADEEDETQATVGAVTDEALLVSAPEGATVSLTFTGADGEPVVMTETANANDYVVFDLTEVEGEITDAVVNASEAIESVSGMALATATALAEAVPEAGEDIDLGTSTGIATGSSNKTNYEYDSTVTTTTTAGTIKPDNGEAGAEGGAAGSVKDALAADGTIVLNFDNAYEADFFGTLRQFTKNSVGDSVAKFTCKGLASGSKDAPALFTTAFELNADTHKYIVMKVRNIGFSTKSIRAYFCPKGGKYSEENALSVTYKGDDYEMLVWDMSTVASWKGTIASFFFSFGADTGATTEIDWIMFTNEVPGAMDEIEGVKELFPVVNKGKTPFTDLESGAWYVSEIDTAYRLGFVTGMTDTTYVPQGTVTVAEAITLAVRLNYTYNGKTLPEVAEGDEWYAPFVDAARKANIIKSNQFTEYNVPALRKEVAAIMYKALPTDYVKTINMFTSVPGVNRKDSAYGAILKLYNAGVLMGSDSEYNFYPETNITRAEMAAIINRLAVPANRKRVVTEAEKEANRKYYYAEDMATCTLGNCYNTKFTIKGDLASATGKSTDPIVYLTPMLGQLDGKNVTKITIGVKTTGTVSAQIYFTVPNGGWAADRMLTGKKGETKADGVTEYIFTPSSNAQFANTITGVRFDPFNAKDIEFSLAYVIVE